jgi:hypothetical protein
MQFDVPKSVLRSHECNNTQHDPLDGIEGDLLRYVIENGRLGFFVRLDT